jgi:hypothetical protein
MGDAGTAEIASNVHWTNILEDYFASTGEKANGLAIMHKRAESIFTRRKTYIDLPVIIGSGVIAFLNAGSSSLFTDHQLAATALGVGSLVVGILNTTGTYFSWAKRAEGHRLSAIHYAKLYRFINVEMRLPRDERMQPGDFLKYVKDQYDRLAEISPQIPGSVTRAFSRQMEKYKDISKPEEANGLNKIEIYIEEASGSLAPLSPPPMPKTPPAVKPAPKSEPKSDSKKEESKPLVAAPSS